MLEGKVIQNQHLPLEIDTAVQLLKHPRLSAHLTDDVLNLQAEIASDIPVWFKGFGVYYRETEKKYYYPVETKEENLFEWSFPFIDWIKKYIGPSPQGHLMIYIAQEYFINGEWVIEELPLSIDMFDNFQHTGLVQQTDTVLGNLIPYLSRHSNSLAIAMNVPIKSNRYLTNTSIEKLSVRKKEIKVSGILTSKALQVERINALLVGRNSGFQYTVHSTNVLDHYEHGAHLCHYRYDTVIYLKDFHQELMVRNIEDDLFDMYFEVYVVGMDEPTMIRVAHPTLMTSRLLHLEAHFSYGSHTYTFVPTYTNEYDGLAIAVTHFKSENHLYYREMLPVAWLIRPFFLHHKIWLVGETPDTAKGNGYYFYKYMREHHPERKVFYVINEHSPDYEKIAELGDNRALIYKSKKHIWYLLISQMIFTNGAPHEIYPSRSRLAKAFIHSKKVYLQNGLLTIQNQVKNLNRFNAQFETDLFIVDSKKEKHFAEEVLHYLPKQVAITGLPRYDVLFADKPEIVLKKQILVYPVDHEMGLHFQTVAIEQIVMRLLALLKSTKMQNYLTTHDLQLKIALPKSFENYHSYFVSIPNSEVVLQRTENHEALLKESFMMLTDYANEAFDFAFLEKPVVFYQFDESLYQVNTNNLTNQERMRSVKNYAQSILPGEICENGVDLFYVLDNLAEKDFKVNRHFHNKITNLLTYHDTNNCERIYETAKSFHKPILRFRKISENPVWHKYITKKK